MPLLLILLSLFLAQGPPADPSRELKLRLVEEINRDRAAASVQPVLEERQPPLPPPDT